MKIHKKSWQWANNSSKLHIIEYLEQICNIKRHTLGVIHNMNKSETLSCKIDNLIVSKGCHSAITIGTKCGLMKYKY